MPLTATVLFDLPQREIASLIVDRLGKSNQTSIVTGFATPGGLETISEPIAARPSSLKTLVVGAATYPAFQTLDNLLAAGVIPDCLRVHLGHTSETGGRKNPFARYHPMLHSKVYYMEFPDSKACAFIGSHNMTSFALTGLNGEAGVLLEGPVGSPELAKVRTHIDTARSQAIQYAPGMKEAYAWWMREFIDGLRAEVKLPQDWASVRTIVLLASAEGRRRPKVGDQLYFEIPAGIQQIESLRTETHLFLFDTLPTSPSQALHATHTSYARYTCTTLGAENRQGNIELVAHWRIDENPTPVFKPVLGRTFRPQTQPGKQQVRAEVKSKDIVPYEYLFEREITEWVPKFAEDAPFLPKIREGKEVALTEAQADHRVTDGWKLVKGLATRQDAFLEKDRAALLLAAPESGSFILVSLRRRKKDRFNHN
jgi:hypothetical protein